MKAPKTMFGMALPRGTTVESINVRGDKSHTLNAPAGFVWGGTGGLHSAVVYTKEELQEVLRYGIEVCETDALGYCEECDAIVRAGGTP